tara:strand:- start:15187 stop:22272 length:7086 start_codon:yes stop_codon:yes gene_type:complete
MDIVNLLKNANIEGQKTYLRDNQLPPSDLTKSDLKNDIFNGNDFDGEYITSNTTDIEYDNYIDNDLIQHNGCFINGYKYGTIKNGSYNIGLAINTNYNFKITKCIVEIERFDNTITNINYNIKNGENIELKNTNLTVSNDDIQSYIIDFTSQLNTKYLSFEITEPVGSYNYINNFTFESNNELIETDDSEYKLLEFNIDNTIKLDNNVYCDILLVGGGGGGGDSIGGGGGGGGQVKKYTNIILYKNLEYNIQIGIGGNIGKNGTSTRFSTLYSAIGGNTGNSINNINIVNSFVKNNVIYTYSGNSVITFDNTLIPDDAIDLKIKIHLWGASGGDATYNSECLTQLDNSIIQNDISLGEGGKGGYTSLQIENFSTQDTLKIFVGQKGHNGTDSLPLNIYPNGGLGGLYTGGGGGGRTQISLNDENDITKIIAISGGGGGGACSGYIVDSVDDLRIIKGENCKGLTQLNKELLNLSYPTFEFEPKYNNVLSSPEIYYINNLGDTNNYGYRSVSIINNDNNRKITINENENDIYFIHSFESLNIDTSINIHKINLTTLDGILIADYSDNVHDPQFMHFINNKLYFSNFGKKNICFIDLSKTRGDIDYLNIIIDTSTDWISDLTYTIFVNSNETRLYYVKNITNIVVYDLENDIELSDQVIFGNGEKILNIQERNSHIYILFDNNSIHRYDINLQNMEIILNDKDGLTLIELIFIFPQEKIMAIKLELYNPYPEYKNVIAFIDINKSINFLNTNIEDYINETLVHDIHIINYWHNLFIIEGNHIKNYKKQFKSYLFSGIPYQPEFNIYTLENALDIEKDREYTFIQKSSDFNILAYNGNETTDIDIITTSNLMELPSLTSGSQLKGGSCKNNQYFSGGGGDGWIGGSSGFTVNNEVPQSNLEMYPRSGGGAGSSYIGSVDGLTISEIITEDWYYGSNILFSNIETYNENGYVIIEYEYIANFFNFENQTNSGGNIVNALGGLYNNNFIQGTFYKSTSGGGGASYYSSNNIITINNGLNAEIENGGLGSIGYYENDTNITYGSGGKGHYSNVNINDTVINDSINNSGKGGDGFYGTGDNGKIILKIYKTSINAPKLFIHSLKYYTDGYKSDPILVNYKLNESFPNNIIKIKNGNVGINNKNPEYSLDIKGDVKINGNINANNLYWNYNISDRIKYYSYSEDKQYYRYDEDGFSDIDLIESIYIWGSSGSGYKYINDFSYIDNGGNFLEITDTTNINKIEIEIGKGGSIESKLIYKIPIYLKFNTDQELLNSGTNKYITNIDINETSYNDFLKYEDYDIKAYYIFNSSESNVTNNYTTYYDMTDNQKNLISNSGYFNIDINDYKYNNSLVFEGTNYLKFNDTINYFSPLVFSISVWCKIIQYNGIHTLVSSHQNGSGWSLYIENDYVKFTSNTSTITFNSNKLAKNPLEWIHLVCIINENEVKVYMNNILIDTQTWIYTQVGTRDNFVIGAYLNDYNSSGSSILQDGSKISDFMFFHKILTEEEIDIIYNIENNKIFKSTFSKQYTYPIYDNHINDLICWYKFDGDLNDSSGNNYHLSTFPKWHWTFGPGLVLIYHYIFENFNKDIFKYGNSSYYVDYYNTNGFFTGRSSGYDVSYNANTNPQNINLSNLSSLTISLWINLIKCNSIFKLCELGHYSGSYLNRISISYRDDATFGITLHIQNDSSSETEYTEIFIEKNRWNHILWTINEDGTWNLYINRNLEKSYTDKIFIGSEEINVFYLTDTNQSILYYDDFRIYNKALSENEISKVYGSNTVNKGLKYENNKYRFYNNSILSYLSFLDKQTYLKNIFDNDKKFTINPSIVFHENNISTNILAFKDINNDDYINISTSIDNLNELTIQMKIDNTYDIYGSILIDLEKDIDIYILYDEDLTIKSEMYIIYDSNIICNVPLTITPDTTINFDKVIYDIYLGHGDLFTEYISDISFNYLKIFNNKIIYTLLENVNSTDINSENIIDTLLEYGNIGNDTIVKIYKIDEDSPLTCNISCKDYYKFEKFILNNDEDEILNYISPYDISNDNNYININPGIYNKNADNIHGGVMLILKQLEYNETNKNIFIDNVLKCKEIRYHKKNLDFNEDIYDIPTVYDSGEHTHLFEYENNIYSSSSFTGFHFVSSENKKLKQGYIVSSTGKYSSINSEYFSDSIKNNIDIEQALPIVNYSNKQKDKTVIGVVYKYEDSDINIRDGGFNNLIVYDKKQGDNRIIINSIGEGGIWVSNYNGSLENGDFITTSPIPGIGMKQDEIQLKNYTVGKITMDCDFKPSIIKKQISKQIQKNMIYEGNSITYMDNVIDIHNNIIYEDILDDYGSNIYIEEYLIQYINLDGEIIDKNLYNSNIHYKIAFVGCTYHCG